ncbi:MAG: hypothetical protein U0350_12550 [Caldilineaceae bacterium]
MLYTYPITIHHLFISPGHNYFGNRTQTPGVHPTFDVETAEVKAGLGLVGDRFYGKGEHFDGHITFFAWEVFQVVRAECAGALGARNRSPEVFRRNVIIEGVNLNQLIGQEFTIDGIRFYGTKHCAPCRWMEIALAPGALKLLRGRGGLRAQVLGDGVLRRGQAILQCNFELNLATLTQPLPTPNLP